MEGQAKKVLILSIERQIKSVQKQLLDISEFIVPPDNWKQFRSKILGLLNDMRRDIDSQISERFSVEFEKKGLYQEVIEVRDVNKVPLSYKEGKEE